MKSLVEFTSSLKIVIVTFGQDFRQTATFLSLRNIAAIAGPELDVLIFDNSETSKPVREGFPGIRLTYSGDRGNPGIGLCYNKATEYASKENKEWILFLDQDCHLPRALLQAYFQAISNSPNENLFCPVLKIDSGLVISPFRFIGNRSFILKDVEPGTHRTRGKSIANNGLLIRVKCFRELGGYNPSIKLDFSDKYFFRKYQRKFASFVVIDCVLNHTLNSISETDRARAISRFRHFCAGSKIYSKEFSAVRGVILQAFLRGVKLSLAWKDHAFLKVFGDTILWPKRSGEK